jgi:hypothetical protein
MTESTAVRIPEKPDFYRAIGHAITRWQGVEASLCEVFIRVSTCENQRIASAIFYSPRDFSEKLTLTRNAARMFLAAGSPLLKQWDSLRARLKSEGEVRNALAHFSLSNIVGGGRTSTVFLTPNFFDPNETFKTKERKAALRELDTAAIKQAGQRFNTLSTDLRAFAQKIPQCATPKPK